MKVLWVNPNFLHPTTKGGQIRTLEMLRRIHQRHEVHYATFENTAEPEGLARSVEYASKVHTFPHKAVSRNSPAFALQVLGGLIAPLPVAIGRFYSPAMKEALAKLIERERFDSIVCDFLVSAPHFHSLKGVLLFQHNVETMIWRRHAETASGIKKLYFGQQADKMFRYEQDACREASLVVAVSQADTEMMRRMFGVSHVVDIPTGVDLDFFAPPPQPPAKRYDLVFVGSMDWMPNVDGMKYFVQSILPLIRKSKPDCSVVIAGRSPEPSILALAEADPNIHVTGTVPDIRPYLWESAVSIVPLRVGGGTRLKIYESVAAGVPVVSTTIGAEGLPLIHGEHILHGDDPESFARHCVTLLNSRETTEALTRRAFDLVAGSFSWDAVTRQFEACMEKVAGQAVR